MQSTLDSVCKDLDSGLQGWLDKWGEALADNREDESGDDYDLYCLYPKLLSQIANSRGTLNLARGTEGHLHARQDLRAEPATQPVTTAAGAAGHCGTGGSCGCICCTGGGTVAAAPKPAAPVDPLAQKDPGPSKTDLAADPKAVPDVGSTPDTAPTTELAAEPGNRRSADRQLEASAPPEQRVLEEQQEDPPATPSAPPAEAPASRRSGRQSGCRCEEDRDEETVEIVHEETRIVRDTIVEEVEHDKDTTTSPRRRASRSRRSQ